MATEKQIYYAKLYILCAIDGGVLDNRNIDIDLYQLRRDCLLLLKERRFVDIVRDLCDLYKEDPDKIIKSLNPVHSKVELDMIMDDIMRRL